MSINNARTFVAKLREDHKFKNKVLQTTGPEDLLRFLNEESLPFDQRELVGAMAECMEQLELQECS
jgi:predicted ribosomally synthesized peptide with nif11-like leader